MQLSINKDDGNIAQVSVSGRVTQDELTKVPRPLRKLLGDDISSRRVLLNMNDTEFLDSSGVSWLLDTHKRFQEDGGRLVLVEVPQVVMNVIKVLRMNLVLNIAENERKALESLEEDPKSPF